MADGNILKMLKNGEPADISKTIWDELTPKQKADTGFVPIPETPVEVQVLRKKQLEAKANAGKES